MRFTHNDIVLSDDNSAHKTQNNIARVQLFVGLCRALVEQRFLPIRAFRPNRQ